MLQKLTLSFLILTVLGAVGLGFYQNTQNEDEPQTQVLRGTTESPTQTPTPLPIAMPTKAALVAAIPTIPESTQPAPQQNSQTMLGDSWQSSGIIVGLDDIGLTLDDGTYVELAPSFYWADFALRVGDVVSIQGFSNGQQIHAQTLTRDGAVYSFRTPDGQPLWSGGAENGQQNGNQAQIPMTEWQTYAGSLSSVLNNSLILQTADAQSITLQLGQPRFREVQPISLNIGDLVEVSGYWQGEQFRVGTLSKTQTGETLLLLDPNGRPLWGGPGRGQGGNTGQSSGGQGNGYQGGRNTTTPESNQ